MYLIVILYFCLSRISAIRFVVFVSEMFTWRTVKGWQEIIHYSFGLLPGKCIGSFLSLSTTPAVCFHVDIKVSVPLLHLPCDPYSRQTSWSFFETSMSRDLSRTSINETITMVFSCRSSVPIDPHCIIYNI